jgi:hypothetical protein
MFRLMDKLVHDEVSKRWGSLRGQDQRCIRGKGYRREAQVSLSRFCIKVKSTVTMVIL